MEQLHGPDWFPAQNKEGLFSEAVELWLWQLIAKATGSCSARYPGSSGGIFVQNSAAVGFWKQLFLPVKDRTASDTRDDGWEIDLKSFSNYKFYILENWIIFPQLLDSLVISNTWTNWTITG